MEWINHEHWTLSSCEIKSTYVLILICSIFTVYYWICLTRWYAGMSFLGERSLAQFMCFFSISGFSISAFQDNFFYDFEAIIILHMTLTFVTYFIKKWNVKNVSTYVNNYHFLHFISILNYFLTKMSNSDETIFILSKFAFCSFLNFEKILKIENFMTIFIFTFNFRQFESKNYR